jgi:hypothetical protein
MQARQEQTKPPDGPSPWPTEHLPLAELRSFVREVVAAMGANRDVMTDARGRPLARVRRSGEDSTCSYLHLIVDMSAIGMPTNTPLNACSFDGDTFVRWHLGSIPLAQTPKAMSPAEAAAVLDMDCLLDAHRRWVRAESGRK